MNRNDWHYWDEAKIDRWNATHPNRQERPYLAKDGEVDDGTDIFDDIVDWIKDTIWGGGER